MFKNLKPFKCSKNLKPFKCFKHTSYVIDLVNNILS